MMEKDYKGGVPFVSDRIASFGSDGGVPIVVRERKGTERDLPSNLEIVANLQPRFLAAALLSGFFAAKRHCTRVDSAMLNAIQMTPEKARDS
jgi:hypothetical protein